MFNPFKQLTRPHLHNLAEAKSVVGWEQFCLRMENAKLYHVHELSKFLDSGIYRFENSNAVFIDPVRVLNRSYTRFKVSPSAYYCRFFETNVCSNPKKRKRKQKKTHMLNERELAADQRHRVIKLFPNFTFSRQFCFR